MKARFEAIYTAALADVLDARGCRDQTLPPAIRPLAPGLRLAGPAYTVQGRPAETSDYDEALRKVLRMLGEVPAGHVAVYACAHDVSAHLGELSVTSLEARGVEARPRRRVPGRPLHPRRGLPRLLPLRDAGGFDVAVGAGGDAGAGDDRTCPDRAGDWVVGDDDGVVVVPHAIAESVLVEAETKAATESEIRVAVRDGMPPLAAYEQYGTF